MKEAVLLVNLGTPDDPSPGKVRRYLTQFLNDRRVIDINPVGRFALVNLAIVPFRSYSSSKLYKEIWTKEGSPLLTYGYQLRDRLQEQLGKGYQVEIGMRYQKPSIASALERLRESRPTRIHVLPLYPQYASSSTGSTIEEVMRCIMGWEVIPDIRFINRFYDDEGYLSALLSVARQYDHTRYDHVLFSYHGLPERQILKASAHYGGDTCRLGACCNTITKNNTYCYRANCFATTRALVKGLGIPEGKYTTSFQSRLDEKWLTPFSDKVVEELARKGAKNILVFSPAFVADCLETIYEIGVEYDHIFKSHGGEKVTLVESLNARPEWVEAVAGMVLGK